MHRIAAMRLAEELSLLNVSVLWRTCSLHAQHPTIHAVNGLRPASEGGGGGGLTSVQPPGKPPAERRRGRGGSVHVTLIPDRAFSQACGRSGSQAREIPEVRPSDRTRTKHREEGSAGSSSAHSRIFYFPTAGKQRFGCQCFPFCKACPLE